MSKIYHNIIKHTNLNGNTNFEIFPRNIHELFLSTEKFKIPSYQRPYSWTSENIKTLLNDIDNCVDQNGWFLGPLFTTVTNGIVKEKEILDGQQRITTIQLILREAYVIEYSFDPPLLITDAGINSDFKKLKTSIGQCLYYNVDATNIEPKFETDPSIKNLLKQYILDGQEKINSFQDRKNNYQEFYEILSDSDVEWSVTVRTIKNAVEEIRNKLEEKIGSRDGQFDLSKIKSFIKYIKTLLEDLWLIEIPLIQEDFILDIFESLNNRGRPLTLVDILRFKTLTNCENSQKSLIQDKWIDIFKQLQQLTDNLIKDEDDFFKVVLNTHSNTSNGISNKDKFIELFNNEFNSTPKIIQFLDEVKSICDLLIAIDKPVDSTNKYVDLFSSVNEKNEVKAILQLVKIGLQCSDNARYLVFLMGRKYQICNSHRDTIKQFSKQIIKSILYIEIYCNYKSNEVRTIFLDLVIELNSNTNNLDVENILNAKKWDVLNDDSNDFNLFHTTNSAYSNFILAFYQYCISNEPFWTGSSVQYDSMTSEHMMPIKWMDSWNDDEFIYTQVDILNIIETIKDDFSNINSYALKNKILSLGSKFQLHEYSGELKDKQENTLIQFIGNKWSLFSKVNTSIGNKSFSEKKSKLITNSPFITIPNDKTLAGLKQYDKFTYSEIIKRSFEIVSTIKKEYSTNSAI